MAQVQVYNQEGKKTSKLELADSVFGIEPNEYAMHLAVVSYLANQRQGTQSTLTRSEVSGGGAKPYIVTGAALLVGAVCLMVCRDKRRKAGGRTF